jgi:hypothetical protein
MTVKPKKRRIQPIAVDDDDEAQPSAQLPVPAFAAQPSDSSKMVSPPESGRRVWISLDGAYDFNYKKILLQKGVKPAARSKEPAGQVLPAMPGLAGPAHMRDGQPGERGTKFL